MDNNLQENNNVVTEKNNNSKLIIVILVILLIGALGFICYDKFINKEKPPVPTPTPIPTNEENSEKKEIGKLYELNGIDKITLPNGKALNITTEEVEVTDDAGEKYNREVAVFLIDNVKVNRTIDNDYIGEDAVFAYKDYVLAISSLPCGSEVSLAFTYDGKVIPVEEKYHNLDYNTEGGNCQELGIATDTFKEKDGKLVVNDAYLKYTLEFIYDGKTLLIQEKK